MNEQRGFSFVLEASKAIMQSPSNNASNLARS